MQRIKMLFFGLLVGVGVGVVLALLFAPKSGQQLKTDAQAQYQQLLAEARQAAATRQQSLEQELAELTGVQPQPEGGGATAS